MRSRLTTLSGGVAVAVMLAAAPACAQFINPFPNSDIEWRQSDLQAMQETATGLLNGTEKIGSAAAWENGETGRKGTVTILDTNKFQNFTCHNLRYTIPNTYQERVRSYRLNWCKTPEGWKIAS
jgi:hypothetical protein